MYIYIYIIIIPSSRIARTRLLPTRATPEPKSNQCFGVRLGLGLLPGHSRSGTAHAVATADPGGHLP